VQRLAFLAVVCGLAPMLAAGASAQAAPGRTYNTVIEKLARGEPVIGGTIDTPDPDTYCAVANAGFDFTWIEMQHSALTYSEVEDMIWACRGAPAIPFIRVPDATEGDIQKATDIGALGIIIPMVDDIQKIRNAVTFAHYPPLGKRSQGGGRYGALWGNDYRATANDNVMIVAMIESPAGVAIAREIANEPGVDAVFAASADLSSFSARRQGDPEYEALVNVIKDETLAAGRVLGGPLAWLGSRPQDGYLFFQGPGAGALIRSGARATLEDADPCRFLPPGTAPVPGEDPCEE
jgi:2-keto-3-deoxy-L-rhamnonate aldolase RhmA